MQTIILTILTVLCFLLTDYLAKEVRREANPDLFYIKNVGVVCSELITMLMLVLTLTRIIE